MRSRNFAIFAIFLLLFSLFSTSVPQVKMYAEEGGQGPVEEGEYGSILNGDGEIEEDRATINKEVSFGNKPGEYFVDLTIKGKERYTTETTDIVVVYDNSNSMEKNNRVGIAKNATDQLADQLLSHNGFRMALVTYGSAVMDGRYRDWPPNGWLEDHQHGNTDNLSHKTFTTNPNDIKSKLPSTIPTDRGKTWDGGTFTQQGLEEAGDILDTSNADHKIVILLTDGVTTFSYGSNGVDGNGSTYTTNHGNRTINESQALTNDGYEVYTIGIEIAAEQGITKAAAEQLVRDMASSPENAHLISDVNELDEFLSYFGQSLTNSIVNGSVEDPMGDNFNLKDASSFTQASDADLTDGAYYLNGNGVTNDISVTTDGQTIHVDGLNLAADEVVNLRYKVQIDTEKEDFEIDTLYRTNGDTYLYPNSENPEDRYKFPEPEASGKGITIEGEKIWEDFGLESKRPDTIQVDLKNGEHVIQTIDVGPDANGDWKFEFPNAIWYDKDGNLIEYSFEEQAVDGYDNPIYEENKIINKLEATPGISLVKTGESTSDAGSDVIEAGKDIHYTFEITNTGNLDLEDVILADELPGISAFTYETLNGDSFDGDIASLILKPGDVLVATATYEVSQEDFDNGQVENYATVEGTPEGHIPNDPNSPQKVTDEDETAVPANLNPAISLVKTADKETVEQAGDTITYTFDITNTGNTTLTEVNLKDPMLGGTIALDVDVLHPGESTAVSLTYDVSQEDINNEEIVNEAVVEGTPPPAYTENPDNPNKVMDEDEEVVTAKQTSDIQLVKEADKENLVAGETITYTFTATNTGNTTLSNVNIVDELEDLSDIAYLAINGDVISDTDFITLQPGDVLVAEASYVVMQSDVDVGQLVNEAIVTGTDPKEEEVTDEDEEVVRGESSLDIYLVKTSDKQYVTEAGQEIEYTFEVTNNSNVTLTDVQVIDDKLATLGIDVVLDEVTLSPGQTTTGTATYTVTEADIAAGTIDNIATATGTPPNPDEEPPTSPPAEDEVPVAKIQLEKSSLPKIYTEANQEIVYEFVITNIGEVALHDVTLTDDMLGGDITLDVDQLAPSESTTVEVPYTVTAEDIEAGEIVNIAATEGTPEGYESEDPHTPGKVTDEDEDTVDYAGLVIEKTSDKEEVSIAGEEIEYTFTVTNTGKTTLEDIVVIDEMLAQLDLEIELNETALEPGESTTGTSVYEVTQADIDNGGVYNIATATGTPPGFDPEDPEFPDEPPVSPPDEEFVPATQESEIELTKVADVKEYSEVGEDVLFTFTVTNVGNTTLTDVKVDDETFQVEIGLGDTTLAPGESTTGTYTHVVTQENLDDKEIYNIAHTEGTPTPVYDPEDLENPIEQEPVTDTDDEQVNGEQNIDLDLEKVADKQLVDKAGEVITYTLTVTNTGNVTLNDVLVHDEMLGGEIAATPSTLAPGEQGTVTGTYVVTQADIDHVDSILNIATATGTPPGGDPEDPDNPKTPPVEEEVPVVNSPQIELVKQADKERLIAGETINYTFTATNVGNVTLHDVNLVDELDGISAISYETINGDPIANNDDITLQVGDVLVATATYEVTQENVDANEVYNYAIVEGTPPSRDNPDNPDEPIEQDPVTDDDDTKVPSEHKPDIAIEKKTNTEEVTEAGQTITYHFIITNTGNVTLDNIKVDDEMLENAGVEIEYDKKSLAPGESTAATGVYTVTQDDIDHSDSIDNIATATGTPPGENPEDPVSPPDEENVPVKKDSSISLEKLADTSTYSAVGEEVVYTFTVTNTGNTTLTDVKVDDETFQVEIGLDETTLAPGESTTGSYTHTITQSDLDKGEVHNYARTEGTPPAVIDPEDPDNPIAQDPVTDEDDELVEGEQNSDLSIEKVADKQVVEEAGEEITYTLTVTNTGNVTLDNVTVHDDMLGGDLETTPSTLAPNEQGTVTGTYLVTQADIDEKEKIVNIATATGTPPGGDPEDPDNPKTPPVEEEVPVNSDPRIALVKQSDVEELVAGDTITYTFTATNVGNTTLNKVNLKDELEGLSEIVYETVNGDAVVDADQITLEPNDVLVATATYEVSQADVDANELYNYAVVEGTPPAKENPDNPDELIEQDPVTDDDDTNVPSEHKPDIEIEKTSDTEEVEKAGEVITYQFIIKNTGNVTLDDVRVDDEMLEDAGVEIVYEQTTLAPGESTKASAEYTVTQDDIDHADSILNIATATGTPPGENPEDPVSPPDEEEVPILKNAEISIEKTAEEEKVVKAGDTITYNFVITNTGNVTLNDVTINDEMLDEAGVDIAYEGNRSLAPGESTEAFAVYTVTQDDIDRGIVKNIATSTGTPPGYDSENPPTDPDDPNYPPVSPPDEAEVPVEQNASIKLLKEANKQEVTKAGENLTYTFTVTNNGNVTLKDVNVFDETFKIDVDLEKTTLAPGETTKGTLQYVVSQSDIDQGEIVNIAIAEGTPPNYGPNTEKPTDKDTENVVADGNPGLELVKTSDVEKVSEVGEHVTYSFVVTNTGNVTVDNIVLDDPMLEEAGIVAELDKDSLLPGETARAKAVYKVTKDDLQYAKLVNIATVTGTPPNYDPEDPDNEKIMDEDSETIVVDSPGKKLPKTATFMFNFLLIGFFLMLVGIVGLRLRRKMN